jgi:uncharacterized protein involved in exopolysaccharide biosynthesis
VTLLALINVVLRRRSWVIATAALAFVVAATYSLLQPRTYSASASFVPQARRTPSNISGLAAQLGLSIPSADAGQSPQFYADLLTSREILRKAVEARYEFATDTGRVAGTLIDILVVDGDRPELRRENGMRALRSLVNATVSQQTGLVTLTVKARAPALARAVADRLLELVNQFNLESRQSQAGQERRFTERRLEEVQQELRAAENRLQTFMQQNRSYENSPGLRFEQDRLARDLTMRQQVYTTLAQAFEQARIEEVRDTPVITVVERPDTPARPDPRGLLKRAGIALALGLVLGIMLAFGREYLVRTREEGSGDFREFAALRGAALQDLVRPWRPVARLLRR